MAHFKDYNAARLEAQNRADRTGLDVAIRKGSKYDPGFNVSYASRNDSDYARAEIVRPGELRTLKQIEAMKNA